MPPDTERREWINLTAEWTSGVNCGKSANFTEASFDYVILTLANWGGKGSWKEIWKSAFFALKPKGKLVFIEWENYYEHYVFMKALQKSKIITTILRLSNFFFVSDIVVK